ncbi:MAG: acyl-CoA/acyl-ACP dehydrogenase [Proteobacteria bacterium]|nr:acyl-CoA/acyl-ACP dehydrogenase [Pseudomonadota bacterium]
MDFTFTEEQQLMAGAFRELTADICAPEQLRALYDGRDTQAEARWARLAELGLFGVLAAEGDGGLGLADADFILLAEEAGHAALPEPLVEQAAVALPALGAHAGLPSVKALLPQLASGEARLALAHSRNPLANLPPAPTHWLLCESDAAYLIEAAGVDVIVEPSIDAGRRLGRPVVRASAAPLCRGAVARALGENVLSRAALYVAAQSLGVGARMLAISVAYAKEREQFGKPIGAYQAIKHHLASVAVKLEFARAVVYAAVAHVGRTGARSLAALSHAKLAAADAADLAARMAIQVHGAMGYSWEVDLHFYMKRAWALAGAWGDHSFHSRRLQGLVCEEAFALGPDQTFERTA